MKKLLLYLCIVFTTQAFAQAPANDNCSGATNLGTLHAPAACGTGIKNGTVATSTGSITSATPENPYVTLTSCSGGTMASPANDVWYTYIAPALGYGVNITIKSTFSTPNIALWTGTCASMQGVTCAVGTAGTTTINVTSELVAGQTYYIQISGGTGQTGTFTLNVNALNDCSGCLESSSLTVNPLPVNGLYQPGQTVSFCFHVAEWQETGDNWLDGVQVAFGNGWNVASVMATPPATLYNTGGHWAYYPAGITSGNCNCLWPAGFYFAASGGTAGQTYGDGGSDGLDTQTATEWKFCWTVTVNAACNPGAALTVTVNTSGDGESGLYDTPGCAGDGATTFNALQGCCPPTVATSSVLCNGGSTGSATATAIVGAAGDQDPYTFVWAGAAAQTNTVTTGIVNSFTTMPAGNYTVTVTDKNLCAASTTLTITQPTVISATVTPTNATCAGTGSITTTVSGGTSPYTYVWTGPGTYTSTTQSPTGLTTAGVYSLTISDHNNCTHTITATVAQTGSITVTATSTTICPGKTGTVTASGATTYSWTTGLSATTGSNVTASPGTTTSYTVTGTTGVCTNTAVATITVNASPTLTVTSAAICNGAGPATLGVSGASTYTWTGGGITGSHSTAPSDNPAATAIYTVNGTGANTCTAVATGTINVISTPTLTVNSGAICVGQQTITLTANSNATTFSWTPAIGLSATIGNAVTANPTTTKTYTIVGTAGTCTVSTTATVTVNSLPTLTVTSATICSGSGPATLGVNGASTYTWTGGGITGSHLTAPSDNPAATTIYTVNGTNANTCTATATGTITINPLPTLTITSASICNGAGPATLGVSGASTYTWTGGGITGSHSTAPSDNPAATTVYTVNGTGANTCTAVATGTINVIGTPTISVNSGVICAGQQTITLTASSNATTFVWTPATGLSATTGSTVTANPTTTQAYTIVGTAGTCTVSNTATVTVRSNPTVTVNNSTICNGGTATLTANGATTYSWSTGVTSTTITASPVAITSYTVTGTTNTCTNTATGTITVNPLPTLTVTSASICNGAGPATLGVSGATTYTWTGGGITGSHSTAPSDNPANTTIYTVNGTDVNTCTATATGTITVIGTPTLTVNSGAICAGQQTITLTANSNATTFAWTPTIGLSATTGSTVTANPAATQVYTIIGTAGTCTVSTTATVTVNTPPTLTVTSSIICVGQQIGTLGVIGASTYTWTGGGITGSNAANPTDSPINTTIYTVNGTDVNTCTATATGTITVNPLPTLTVTSASICNGAGPATLGVSGATTYTWTGGGITGSHSTAPSDNPANTTIYTVNGTDVNTCTATVTGTITVIGTPTLTVNSGAICAGQQTITLTANSNATTFAWTPTIGLSATTGSTVTANPAATQVYTIIGTAGTCTVSTTATVTVNTPPTLTVTSSIICVGQQIGTLGVIGASTYTWTGGGITGSNAANPTDSPINTTIYTVNGTDVNTCTATATGTITVNPLPTLTVTSGIICVGQQTVTITASGANTYTWVPTTGLSAATGSSVLASPPSIQNYVITGTDINGCTNVGNTSVSVNQLPNVTATSTVVCAGSVGTITAGGASTYTWNTLATGATLTQISAATTPYSVVGTDVNGCKNSATATITVNQLPVPVATSNAPCVTQQALILNCTSVGLTYSWSGPNSFVSTAQNPTIPTANVNATVAGIYTVTVVDGNACTNTTTVDVAVNPLPNVTATSGTICIGQSTTLMANGASTYSWTPGTGLSTTMGSIVVANPTSLQNYIVTGTDLNTSCVSAAFAQVVVNGLPPVTATSSTICVGQQTTLTASGASTYSWNPVSTLSNPFGASVIGFPHTKTIYTVTGTNNNGCVNTAIDSIMVNPLPSVITNTIAPDCIPFCPAFSVSVTPTAAKSYIWNFSNGTTPTTVPLNPSSSFFTTTTCFTVSGVFPVTISVTDIQGCINTASTTVTTFAIPVADFTYGLQPVNIMDPNVQFTNLSTQALHYNWNFGDPYSTQANDTSALTNPSHLYSIVDTFFVALTVSTVSGCTATVTEPIIINDYSTLYVPNAFSPNGDGKNEMFLAEGVGINSFKMYIFDRWGLLLYYSEDISKGWNGTYQARGTNILQEDVYVWKIEATDFQNKARNLHGTVTLLK